MSKEKIFIVMTHKHSLNNKKKKTNSPDDWKVTETVEFVNQLRNRHITMSSAIGDYINRSMVSGSRIGMTDYAVFENYIRKTYKKELDELDRLYRENQVKEVPLEEIPLITDQFGNLRAKTVFDL